MTADVLAQQLEEDGFVIIRQLVKGEGLKTLQEAAARTAAKARVGDWPYVRTVGKQFPPWDRWDRAAADKAATAAKAAEGSQGGGRGIWGVQHLLRPELGPDAAVFVRSYFAADGVLDVAKRLLGPGCRDDDLVMELYNMLVRPDYDDFALRWHRDDIPPEATAAEELTRLGQPAWHAQWNLALWDDASLVVVPGSHRRARTAAERAADPFADPLPVEAGSSSVGQLVVHLGPGDAVFYNNNILHRGVYHTAVERATLHGSVGHVGGSRQRARNVLQHGVGDWVDRCDFGSLTAAERARAEGMRDRLVLLGRASGDVGYSQEE
ncbi:phytanoyl-dioxygenase family protein [Grosmannia clavigera kw1407]|uniref:Phytanoyl-dioxygenase family protein n=1 Tax=Grosmannia clavigera (strain kw1407 / UAMH 11150) TaxID=655863 RepID=F0XC69_GROCL|nr:phytanoyl-dioxygenase family protein [Grosmannia clavigera kw1407]EFX04289.1 phytanoyl-dioxygenase family protein [Grosmannia clavigera kw1407]